MSDMILVKSADFNGIPFECYRDNTPKNNDDFWVTREQIGLLLGYSDPSDSIAKIHQRNKERLDKFSRVDSLSRVEGERVVTREATVYNFKGLLEICRYSQQQVANDVMDFLYNIADEIRRTGSYLPHRPQDTFAVDAAIRILEVAGITGNQAALALDKVYRRCTGFSLLETAGIQLVSPVQEQVLTPTELGKQFGLSARRINEVLAGMGYQYNIEGHWEPLGEGLNHSVLLDTNKRHSDGTPVKQLKWYTSVLPALEQSLDASA